MENALWKDRSIAASDISDSFEEEREVRKASSRKELRCPDKCCGNPIVRYCHGEIKGAYFAHLINVRCDYAAFDKSDTPVMRFLRHKLYQHFLKRGFEIQCEEKLLAHHYSQLFFSLQDGGKLAVELGTNQTSADVIETLVEEYKRESIALQWLVVSDINQGRGENEVFYLKRYLLNMSQEHEFMVINTDGTKLLQTRWDKSSNQYYTEMESFELLELEDGKFTIKGFSERFQTWLQEMRERVAQIKEIQERETRTIYNFFSQRQNIQRSRTIQGRKLEDETRLKSHEERKAEIMEKICQQEEPVYDSSGVRWIQCEQCGKIDEDCKFNRYGGENHVNLGVCNDCIKKNRR